MSLPIVPPLLSVSRPKGRHTGADRLNDETAYPIATNVPAGRHETRTIVSSVNATMYPRKRYRVSGFNSIHEGKFKPIGRPLCWANSVVNYHQAPRLPLIMGKGAVSGFGAKGNV